FEKRRHRRLAQSLERSDRRRHLHARDDGLFQTAHDLAGRTKQRPPDWLGLSCCVRCPQRKSEVEGQKSGRALTANPLNLLLKEQTGEWASDFVAAAGTPRKDRVAQVLFSSVFRRDPASCSKGRSYRQTIGERSQHDLYLSEQRVSRVD